MEKEAKKIPLATKDGKPNPETPWHGFSVKQRLAEAQKRKLSDKMFEHHIGEIARKKADAYNIGMEEKHNYIMSKTDKGRLHSSIDEKGKVTHNWQKGEE